MTSRFVVTGATGFVGSAFVERLVAVAAGCEIVTLGRRRPPAASGWRSVDLASGESLAPLGRADVVVHIAAEKRDPARMQRVNVEGTRALLRAAADAGVVRFVLLSSVGVYGARPGSGRVTEAFPHTPANEYERTKDMAESETIAFCADAGIECVVLEPTNVVGHHADGAAFPLLSLMRNVRRGRVVRVSAAARANYVAVSDVAQALVLATLTPNLSGTFIVNEPMRLDDLLARVAEAVNARAPRLSMPPVLARAAGAAGSVTERVLRRSLPLNRERVRDLMNSTWYDSGALHAATGFAPAALAATIQHLAHLYTIEGRL